MNSEARPCLQDVQCLAGIPAKFKPELFESQQNKISLVSQQTDFMTPQATLGPSPTMKNIRSLLLPVQATTATKTVSS